MRLHERIQVVPAPMLRPDGGSGSVYLYLVFGDRLVLIDTGFAGTPAAAVAPALDPLGLRLADVRMIINTHGHPDHASGNAEVKDASPGAVVCAHPADAPFLERPLEWMVDTVIAPMCRHAGRPDAMPQVRTHLATLVGGPSRIDRPLGEGDELDLGAGIRFRVLHTPGHSAGSICLYWEAEGVLIAGDAVQGFGPDAGELPAYFQAGEYVASLDRLRGLAPRALGMGHAMQWSGPDASPLRFGPEIRRLLEDSVQISAAIDRAVREAVRRHPDAGFALVARQAVELLSRHFRVQSDPMLGLPLFATPTLFAHYRAVMAESGIAVPWTSGRAAGRLARPPTPTRDHARNPEER